MKSAEYELAKRSGRSWRRSLSNRAWVGIGLIAAVVAGLVPATASANPPPFNGLMSFPAIQSPADPEEFSWKVRLGEDQQLEAVDDQTARVRYTEGLTALVITAEPAHDADGLSVPTSLAVSDEDVLSLLVHHRAGDPTNGGVPFTYPVVNGTGWEAGFSTVIVKGPPDDQELREERERRERERSERERFEESDASKACSVPRLKSKSLKASKRRLREAGCRIGKVKRLAGVTAENGKVVRQSPVPGTMCAQGSVVRVTLGDVSGVPIAVPTEGKSSLFPGRILPRLPEMMTDDAKFALGF